VCVLPSLQAEDAREAETRKLRDELSQRDAELHEARRECDALRRKLPHGASDARPTKAAEPEAHPAVSGAGRVMFGGVVEAEGGEKEAKARQVEASLRERVRQLEQALATAQEELKVEGEQAEEDVAQVRGVGKAAWRMTWIRLWRVGVCLYHGVVSILSFCVSIRRRRRWRPPVRRPRRPSRTSAASSTSCRPSPHRRSVGWVDPGAIQSSTERRSVHSVMAGRL
jgi:hypothetical protein